MPRVSVIIPSYNCARFVGRALRSALEQTYTDYEIILADDGSTDDTQDVVLRYGAKVRYMYQPNRGVSAARNLALSAATGDLIAYLDADDMWYPQKLDKQVRCLDENPTCGLVHTDVDAIDADDQIVRSKFNHTPPRQVPQGHCLLDLLRRHHMQLPTVVVRHDLVRKVGFFDERVSGVEDYLQWIGVAMEGRAFSYIDEPLALYRWRVGSLSTNTRRMNEHLVKLFRILLTEKNLERRWGSEAAAIVCSRLYELGRDLAYQDRFEGDNGRARHRLLGLIKEWPLRLELYSDLLKASLPSTLASRLARLRNAP
jgi:glycosyltransferase involved in cell wall biosynthesis